MPRYWYSDPFDGDTMGAMASPRRFRVRIDKQGRFVLPQILRDELIDVPGELFIDRTSEGLLLRPVHAPTKVRMAEDGLPLLDVNRVVTNEEVLNAIDNERSQR